MNFTKSHIFILLIGILLLCLPMSGNAEPTAIKWYSFQEGVEKVKKENKKGFLHFYTDWCVYCKMMNANTFSDKKVVDFLNHNFVPIMINAEKLPDVAKTYNANKFPFSVFIAEDISMIGSRPGYITPDIMMDMLIYIQTNTYKTMTFNDYIEKNQAKKTASPPTQDSVDSPPKDADQTGSKNQSKDNLPAK